MPNQEQQREEVSKKACNKIREVFAETIKKWPKGDPSKGNKKPLDWSNDEVIINEFADEWTWYMQGSVDAIDEYHKGEVDVESIKTGLILFLGNKINRVDLPTMTETINYLLPHLQPRAESEWTCPEDRIPEGGECVLVIQREWPYKILERDWMAHTDQDDEWFKKKFSHWLPKTALPAVPKTQTTK